MYINVGARGWIHRQWQAGFYPEDLPQDWQLSYYANEFDVLLSPKKEWSAITSEELSSLVADLPEEFSFFAEVEGESDVDDVKKMLCESVCSIHQVSFPSANRQSLLNKIWCQSGEIVSPPQSVEKELVLLLGSDNVIKTEEIRQIIENVQDNYRQFDNVHLFFDQALLDFDVLNQAKIIVDLLASPK